METSFAAALGIGLTHTVLGPDHYLPFLVLGRARRWTLSQTLAWTFACGVGHVGSSVLLGLAGAAMGAGLAQVQALESDRGTLAGWALLVFGLAYGVWGVWLGLRRGPHRHVHLHADGTIHFHRHDHPDRSAEEGEHHGPASAPPESRETRTAWHRLTPWVLFLIFVLGPCEPLIPLFFADAVAGRWGRAAHVALGYGASTLVAMISIVAMAWTGLFRLRLGALERFAHAVAGGVLFLAGAGMVFLGL